MISNLIEGGHWRKIQKLNLHNQRDILVQISDALLTFVWFLT